ncbi:glycosyltransferase [bacterium]|nr:glycosyltransferase [candidate division CSSED10-310 bacterium]
MCKQICPVTVVIPTYNRENDLVQAINDLLLQSHPEYEILIIDQTAEHEESTAMFLHECADRIRLIRLPVANLPAARNEGIRKAKYKIVVFVDDDARIPRDYLLAHARNYADSSIQAVAGPVLAPEKRWKQERPEYADDPLLRIFNACWQFSGRCEVSHAPGGNMSFYREIALKAGLFDENYHGPGFREESDFFIRLTRLGVKIIYDPSAWIIHPPGFRTGGCWSDHNKIPSKIRFFNHAYFVFKNFDRRLIFKLFFRDIRSHFIRRYTCLHPLLTLRKIFRFTSGWFKAMREAPRESFITATDIRAQQTTIHQKGNPM